MSAPDTGNSRLRATRILASLMEQQGSLASLLVPEDDPLTRELCYGSCRRFHRLDAALSVLMDRPLKTRDRDVHALLLIGLYQLEYLRVKPHAAVNETVSCTRALGKPWARGLVNGVLRQFQRRRKSLWQDLEKRPQAHWSHPDWMIKTIRNAWPSEWEAVLSANNQHPPMTLRVNTARLTREEYLARLAAQDIGARAGQQTDTAVYLDNPVDARQLPGFAEGECSVQDEASQRVAPLLDLAPGQRVLDACAAPGGKTTLLLEQQSGLDLLAVDVDERRLGRVRDNLARSGVTARVVCADVLDSAGWWDGQSFDRILLDAPCTATGILRRQPDIRLLRQSGDVARMAALQSRMLDVLWDCLRPGGRLLYTTCSVLPAENSEQIAAFLARHPDACLQTVENEEGPGLQQLPEDNGPDGFFYAPLMKQPAGQ
ncbi:MAG: 16S rRNA (cytosine(967)-C(5))-methyltransferase RsmB [Pseudohongiellaceae bacterium]